MSRVDMSKETLLMVVTICASCELANAVPPVLGPLPLANAVVEIMVAPAASLGLRRVAKVISDGWVMFDHEASIDSEDRGSGYETIAVLAAVLTRSLVPMPGDSPTPLASEDVANGGHVPSERLLADWPVTWSELPRVS